MISYSVPVYSLDAASTNVAGIITQHKGGNPWDWNSRSHPTPTLAAGAAPVAATIAPQHRVLLRARAAAGWSTCTPPSTAI